MPPNKLHGSPNYSSPFTLSRIISLLVCLGDPRNPKKGGSLNRKQPKLSRTEAKNILQSPQKKKKMKTNSDEVYHALLPK